MWLLELFIFSSNMQIWYVEVGYLEEFQSPLEIEITGVDYRTMYK